MIITTDSFFEKIQNGLDSCYNSAGKSNCLNPSKHEKIKELFNAFLSKAPSFGACEQHGGFYTCPATDGSSEYLHVRPDPLGFSMSIDKSLNVGNGMQQIQPGFALTCSKGSYGSQLAYTCQGSLPGINKWAYSIRETTGGVCQESYSSDPVKGTYFKSNWNTNLFEKFLSQSQPKEISLNEKIWSYAKIGAGITSTVYFAYKTYLEVSKLWIVPPNSNTEAMSTKIQSDEGLIKANRDVKKSDEGLIIAKQGVIESNERLIKVIQDVEQPKEAVIKANQDVKEANGRLIKANQDVKESNGRQIKAIQDIKKRAALFGVATLASGIFTAITYFTDIASMYESDGSYVYLT